MPREDSRVEISIPSRYENIVLVDLVAEASLRHLGLDEETVEKTSLAVREAVANGIQHGNAQRPGKRVLVDLDKRAEEIVIRISDEGAGFDPEAVPDPLAPENILKPSGRGILMMKTLMDRVKFDFEGPGTVVTLRKRLPSRGGEDDG